MSDIENQPNNGVNTVEEVDHRFNSGQPRHHSGSPRVAIKISDHVKRTNQPLNLIVINLLEKIAREASHHVHINRLITSQENQAIADMIERAKNLNSTYEPVDFTVWIQAQLEPRLLCGPEGSGLDFDLTKNIDVDDFLRHLQRLEEVDSAYALREDPPPKSTMN